MIFKNEIDSKAEELGIHTSNVQRDYVFGWLLSALFQPDNPLSKQLILKGGNCFRKAYFENARFSNDLDFSVETKLDEKELFNSLKQACIYAGSHSGIEFHTDSSRIEMPHLVDNDNTLYKVRIYFKSFYGEENITLKVRLDIKEYERIFLPIQTRELIHSYSDNESCRAHLQCLKLEELLAAKLKALLQRSHSPDLYDFVHATLFQKKLDIRRLEVVSTLLKKTIYEPNPDAVKGLFLRLPFQTIRVLWNNYLVCPRMSIFSFDDAESWFKNIINELFSLLKHQETYAGHLSYFDTSHRDLIMEAGRLHRIMHLVYGGFERKIEPYALAYKRRRDGIAREYFYAWDLSGGSSGHIGIKSFVNEKVHSLRIENETFEPQFPIELIKTSDTPTAGYFSQPRFGSASRRSPKVRTHEVLCMVECSCCGRQFSRSSYKTSLKKHNDMFGNPCYGRIGFIVR